MYAVDAVTVNPARLHQLPSAAEVSRPATPFIVVAWGSGPAHAAAARRRADDFAYDNRLYVVNHIVSHCTRVRDAALYDIASTDAVYRSATYDMVWWLLTATSRGPDPTEEFDGGSARGSHEG
ncbi:hypothetical protein [Streptodolium elevatio]